MDSGKLFAYSVEEREGAVVLTLSGSLIEQTLQALKENLSSGGSLPVQALLSPLVSITQLLAASSAGPGTGISGQLRTSDIDASLSQEVDQAFSSFQEEMRDLAKTIEELKAQRGEGAAERGGEAAEQGTARRGRGRSSGEVYG